MTRYLGNKAVAVGPLKTTSGKSILNKLHDELRNGPVAVGPHKLRTRSRSWTRLIVRYPRVGAQWLWDHSNYEQEVNNEEIFMPKCPSC